MDSVGYFNDDLDPLSDWELWVRGIVNGSVYWCASNGLGHFGIYRAAVVTRLCHAG